MSLRYIHSKMIEFSCGQCAHHATWELFQSKPTAQSHIPISCRNQKDLLWWFVPSQISNHCESAVSKLTYSPFSSLTFCMGKNDPHPESIVGASGCVIITVLGYFPYRADLSCPFLIAFTLVSAKLYWIVSWTSPWIFLMDRSPLQSRTLSSSHCPSFCQGAARINSLSHIPSIIIHHSCV